MNLPRRQAWDFLVRSHVRRRLICSISPAKQSSSSEQRQNWVVASKLLARQMVLISWQRHLHLVVPRQRNNDQLSSVASLANEILKPTESKSDTWSMNITGGTELSFADDQLTVYVQNESEAAAPGTIRQFLQKATVSQPQDAAAPIQPDQAEHHADDAGKQVPDPIVKSVDNTGCCYRQSGRGRYSPSSKGGWSQRHAA